MKSTGFYRQIPGLGAPWSVRQVGLDMAGNRVEVRVELDRSTKWFHPETKEAATLHKWTKRRWRDLDTCQFETIIEAEVPSVKCRDGTIEEVTVPWAGRCQRFTKLPEQAVIMWLEPCGNVDKVAGMMRLDWQTVNSIMNRAVARGLLRRGNESIRHMGVDEKSFRRGHVHASILNDLDHNRVWDLVEGRTTDMLGGFRKRGGGGIAKRRHRA